MWPFSQIKKLRFDLDMEIKKNLKLEKQCRQLEHMFKSECRNTAELMRRVRILEQERKDKAT
jgi:hypothetical protein